MTFDEFKINFEKFSKIDSAEKLAICEQKYQQHLLHIADQDYFEPVEDKPINDLHSKYLAATENILTNSPNETCQYAYIVRPSFEPEYSLCLSLLNDQFSLTYTILEKNYWAISNGPHNLNKSIRRCCSTIELNKNIGNKLILLSDRAIMMARKRQSNMIILDGILFTICRYNTSETTRVSRHSPSQESVSGKIIEIMEQLIQFAENSDMDSTSIEKEIDSLLK